MAYLLIVKAKQECIKQKYTWSSSTPDGPGVDRIGSGWQTPPIVVISISNKVPGTAGTSTGIRTERWYNLLIFDTYVFDTSTLNVTSTYMTWSRK